MFFTTGQEAELAAYETTNPVAGAGWIRPGGSELLAWGIAERVDDYCATAYVYCRAPQPVPPLDVAAALADIERRPYEQPLPMEHLATAVSPDQG
jgi:D-arabinan exo alpha-(1,3)/(1,5)-arabinofuranosidase (non-reducing end)